MEIYSSYRNIHTDEIKMLVKIEYHKDAPFYILEDDDVWSQREFYANWELVKIGCRVDRGDD